MIFLPFLGRHNLGNVVKTLKFRTPRVLLENSTGSPQSDSPGPPRLALYSGGLSKHLGGGGCKREGLFRTTSAQTLESGGSQKVINTIIGLEGGAVGRNVTTGQWSVGCVGNHAGLEKGHMPCGS